MSEEDREMEAALELDRNKLAEMGMPEEFWDCLYCGQPLEAPCTLPACVEANRKAQRRLES